MKFTLTKRKQGKSEFAKLCIDAALAKGRTVIVWNSEGFTKQYINKEGVLIIEQINSQMNPRSELIIYDEVNENGN